MTLTAKQQKFINEYFACGMNATQAAIRAGYSEKTARSIAHENLTKPDIKAEIERIYEESTVSAKEVLARFSDHARGDIGDIWDESTGQIDWQKARESGKTALIKRIKHKTIITTDKDGEGTTITEDELELHDPQKALQLLGKHHKLFIDRTEISGVDGKPIEVKAYRNFSPDEWDTPDPEV